MLIIAGRHMLTEMVVDHYIPNDTHMTEDEARVQVCFWCLRHVILCSSEKCSEWSVKVVSAHRSTRSQNKTFAYAGNCSLTLDCTGIHYCHSM